MTTCGNVKGLGMK